MQQTTVTKTKIRATKIPMLMSVKWLLLEESKESDEFVQRTVSGRYMMTVTYLMCFALDAVYECGCGETSTWKLCLGWDWEDLLLIVVVRWMWVRRTT